MTVTSITRALLTCAALLAYGSATALTHIVDTTEDTLILGGCVDAQVACSLRQALHIAEDGDLIQFDESIHGSTIVLTQGNFFIRINVSIVGPGANLLTIDANNQSGHIYWLPRYTGLSSLLSGVTLTGGNGEYDIYNDIRTTGGGAIYTEDTFDLVIDGVVMTGNTTSGSGGGIQAYNGRTILRNSLITNNFASYCSGVAMDQYDSIYNSTISNNVSDGTLGNFSGAVCFSTLANMVNTTVSGNQSAGPVSGVYARKGHILSSTIVDNSTTYTGPTAAVAYSQDGFSTSVLANSIVAGNLSSSEDFVSCRSYDGPISVTYSLVEQSSANATSTDCGPLTAQDGNIVHNGSPLIGVILGPLANNGGAVPTHAILNPYNNVLTDSADPSGCFIADGSLLTEDARKSLRPANGCDIGAYEFANSVPVLTSPGNQMVIAGQTLTFGLQATDADNDLLTFSGVNLSTPDDDDTLARIGASLDPSSGVFTWTPGPDQAGNYELSFSVYDDASPVGLDMVVIVVTVGEQNRPPILADITPITASVGDYLVVSFEATDPDGDGFDFSYADLPAGALLSDGNIEFYWEPTADQVGTHTIEVTVTDRGTPPLSATGTLIITIGGALTPEELIVVIRDEVIALGLDKKDEKKLVKHTAKASKHLKKGKTGKAIKELNKFIKDVQRQLDDGVLTAEQASLLQDLAQQAIDLLSQT